MSRWIDFSVDERKAMIQRVVDEWHIDEVAVEKDWWVTAILYAMFHTTVADFLLFKGGTSLSKGWNIINRFSEDVDLALSREFFLKIKNLSCANCANNTQTHNFREKGQDFLYGEFVDELRHVLKAMGLDVKVLTANDIQNKDSEINKTPHDKDPSVFYVQYPSIYDGMSSYAAPSIKVEISILSMAEPYEVRRISSFIEQIDMLRTHDSDYVQSIPTVSPSRTFLEKAFLLCEEFQKDHPRTHRMTRHFYDLEKLMDTPYAKEALSNVCLYREIVEHRRKYYHLGYVDYDNDYPQQIKIVPDEKLISRFDSDYEEMKASFIYGEPLEFDALMSRIRMLQERFREIDLKKTI